MKNDENVKVAFRCHMLGRALPFVWPLVAEFKDGTLSGPIRANRFSLRKKPAFANRLFKKLDSSEDWTRITRISMRIGEKTRFARIWPSASKIGFFLRIDSRESAKRWCANRLPTKMEPVYEITRFGGWELQLKARLAPHFSICTTNSNDRCSHEFIIDCSDIRKKSSIGEEDIAKRLQDMGRCKQVNPAKSKTPSLKLHISLTSFLRKGPLLA